MITILIGANQQLASAHISLCENLLKHTEYCLLQTEVAEAALLEATRLAHKHGAKTTLKPAASHINRTLMEYIDVFVPSRIESMLYPRTSLT